MPANKYTIGSVEAVWHRRKWLALVSFVLPLAVGGALTFSVPPLFESTALVLVDAPPGSSTREVQARLGRLTEQNLSRSRLATTVARYALYPDLAGEAPDEAIRQLRRDLRIESKNVDHSERATVALGVSYRGRPPATVASVAQDFADFYVTENCRHRKEEAAGTLARVDSQLRDVGARLADEGRRVSDFIDRHLYELPQQTEVNLLALERLRGRLLRTQAPTQKLASQRVTQIQEELTKLRGQYTTSHPDVVRLQAELDALRMVSGSGTSDAPASDDRQLRATVKSYEQRIYNAPRRKQELDALMLPFDSTKALYGSLLVQREDARFAANLECEESTLVSVADSAVLPEMPIAPDRARLAFSGLAIALMIAALVVLITEQTDTSFHSSEQLRGATRLPVLATIPVLRSAADRRRRRQRSAALLLLLAVAVTTIAMTTVAVATNNEALVRLLAHGG